MQHPDEGTIHAWLEGALGDSEAARIAAHVEACAECAERTREARGLIAGASRIVAATDWGVGTGIGESGTAPATAPPPLRVRRRWFTPMRAAAAALLFVAAGTLLMAREADRATVPRSATVAAQRLPEPHQLSAPPAVPPASSESAPRAQTARRAPVPRATPPAHATVAQAVAAAAPRADSAAPSLDSAAPKKAGADAMRARMALNEVVVTGMPAAPSAAAAGGNAFARTTDAPRCYDVSSDSTAARIGPRIVLLSGGRVSVGKVTDSVEPMSWRADEPGLTEVLVGQPPVRSLLISEHGRDVTAVLREGSSETPIKVRRCP